MLPAQKDRLQIILLYITCIFLLLLPACYNGYPLVTPDTGTYIFSGWDLHVPIDRPVTYGIFIRICSLSGLSLWPVIFMQAFLLVYFLRRISRKLLQERYSDARFFGIVALLATFTSAGWATSQVTPDIFTAILFLAIADFYFTPATSPKSKVYYFLVIWFFSQQHTSNLLILLALCILARGYTLLFTKRKWFARKTLFLFCVTLFSFISMSFFNLWEGNSFRPSPATHVFMMSRMAENGILDEFLEQYCPTEHYSICAFRGKTGDRQWDFMWNSNGHLYYAGGWDKTEKEYNTIIRRSFTRPRYLFLQLYEAAEASVRQLPQATVSLMPQGSGCSPYVMVDKYFHREIKEYRTALQQLNILPGQMAFFNALIFIFLVICLLLIAFRFEKSRTGTNFRNWNFFLVWILAGVVVNAAVTATFSTVVDRLQARVLWLLPFAIILLLVKQLPGNTAKKANDAL